MEEYLKQMIHGWRGASLSSLLASITLLADLDIAIKLLLSIGSLIVIVLNALNTYEQWQIRKIEKRKLQEESD